MNKYIYLCITPEALIGSMLPPHKFGTYLATGTKKRNKGQAIYFELDPDLVSDIIDMNYLTDRCVAKSDGSPKNTVYLSVYRVLESIPVQAFRNLYLTNDHGIVLELFATHYNKYTEKEPTSHLYQELCPVTPQVVSSYSPPEFLKTLTDDSLPIHVPKLFFVELKLGELAVNPLSGSAENLPYPNLSHLRDCLETLKDDSKKMKTVIRFYNGELLFRTIASGFYIGSKNEMLYYQYPTMAELEKSNYEFLRTL
ncbi:MAG: hypothetical protein JW973_05480 [Bacteroidales bacterium]|nr:hypothetical protein [Bacteroidales bacterium]